MEVQLYVYDLSQGLARQFSGQFLGTQIDAVYHTSIVIEGIEYFFGAGVQTSYAGSTHHGAPMEIIPMGKTELPIEVILEYLESLKQVYTAESYDLFMKNCNNFSNDFAIFLVGKGIPDHITTLPQTVLNTPFGQMLRPALDRSMRDITQAPVPPQQVPRQAAPAAARATNGSTTTNGVSNGTVNSKPIGKVSNVTSSSDVDRLLSSAKDRCAVVFFTSSTCAPCKIVYPAYDELAAEAGDKAILIKVDINSAYEVASKFNVRATPTFMTFLKGKKEDEWSGANESKLKGNVRLLLEACYPPHPHRNLDVPILLRQSLAPVTFTKVPPLEKLLGKLGPTGNNSAVTTMRSFIEARNKSAAQDVPLPDLTAFSTFLQTCVSKIPLDCLFAAYDMLRLALIDPRISAFFIEPPNVETIKTLLTHVTSMPPDSCPYNLRIVSLHLACNLFTVSAQTRHTILSNPALSSLLVNLVSSSLLDSTHTNVRIAASCLALNLSSTNHRSRLESNIEALPEAEQVELVASILETLGEEQSPEAAKAMVLALGWLAYCTPREGEVWDLCKAMDASGTVQKKEGIMAKESGLVREVGSEMLERGLR